MQADGDASREVPPVSTCGAYRVGHDVHFIQARLSRESGPGVPRTVVAVADDGTITFTVGAAVWNHDPERLRSVLDRHGREVRLCSRGVLRVPNGHGDYCFSVAAEADPCRSDTVDLRPGESVAEELQEWERFDVQPEVR